MASITLSTLRTRIKQRTDQEYSDSEFVTDAELTQLINTSYNELYGLLVRHSLHRTETTHSITANGALSYALPSDFYSVLGVWRLDGTARTFLPRHDHRHRPDTGVKGPANTYRIIGLSLQFSPFPQSGTYELVYVPVPGTLSADGDTLDGVLGWEEYVIVDVAIRVLMKEESDVSDLQRERERLAARIVDEANHAEMSEGLVVANTRGYLQSYDEGDYTQRGYRGSILGRRWW